MKTAAGYFIFAGITRIGLTRRDREGRLMRRGRLVHYLASAA